jgi:hypothetical protein
VRFLTLVAERAAFRFSGGGWPGLVTRNVQMCNRFPLAKSNQPPPFLKKAMYVDIGVGRTGQGVHEDVKLEVVTKI